MLNKYTPVSTKDDQTFNGKAFDVEMNPIVKTKTKQRQKTFVIIIIASLTVVTGMMYIIFRLYKTEGQPGGHQLLNTHASTEPFPFPKVLQSVYNEGDFMNEHMKVPSYWVNASDFLGFSTEFVTKDIMKYAASTYCYNDHDCYNKLRQWGPCYPPLQDNVEWESLIENNNTEIEYPNYIKHVSGNKGRHHLHGMCRPGFLIIGAGKCGTSSLYHYIVGHPRVLPARQKQIHYFKYYPQRELDWYYSNFPSTESFLSSGALMTGEAAPGYIPYPDVSHLVSKRMPGSKILTIAREPLDRAWSSYNYNYVREVFAKINQRKTHYPQNKPDDYYKQNYMFSFEDFIRIELDMLKKCLEPGGYGETKSKEKHYFKFKNEYQRRESLELPPMIDILGVCYPQPRLKSEPREQWYEMMENNTEKIIKIPNLHLVEAFIGRGMYALQVEWWYALHQEEYLVCTEDMKEAPATTLQQVSSFLGLPTFNFSDVVHEGLYNVAGHKGYDKAISWETFKEESQEQSEEIPISDGLKAELLEFLKPYNDRLFELAGKSCSW